MAVRETYEVVAERINDRGITVAELARRVGMKSELLRRSLSGERKLYSSEFVPICRELDLEIDDFTVTD